jgi:hypothetical protein
LPAPAFRGLGWQARAFHYLSAKEKSIMQTIHTAAASPLVSNLIASLDIDAYNSVLTGDMVINDPKTGAPTTSVVTLASPEHEARKRIDLARTRKLRSEYAQTGKMPQSDPLEDIEDETEYLVASVLAWNLTQGGQPVPSTPEVVRKLLGDPSKKWLRTQVLAGVNKSELFIIASAKS